jgi:hypothetical protein
MCPPLGELLQHAGRAMRQKKGAVNTAPVRKNYIMRRVQEVMITV